MRNARRPLSSVACVLAVAVAFVATSCENWGGLLGQVPLRLTGPSGGEVLSGGDTVNVEWEAYGVFVIRAEISRDGNWVDGDGSDVKDISWVDVYPVADGPGSVSGKLYGPASTNCRIRIFDPFRPGYVYDVSGPFEIRYRPVQSSPPADATVNVGETATFSVGVSDLQPVQYQWQKDGVDIPGETSPGYTTPPATMADDGAVFRCVLTNAWGTTTSSPGVLSIRRFTELDPGLPGVAYCCLAWGDYDGDGDMDLALAGSGIARLCRNEGGGSFTVVDAGLPAASSCSLAWGDCDNDGDLDLALLSRDTSRLCRNEGGGSFTVVDAGLPALGSGSVAWGDYDNDGDLDLAIAGYDETVWLATTRLCRNEGGGSFTVVDAGLTGVRWCSLAWGDYDNDGDLDLALAGYSGSPSWRTTEVYANSGGVLSDSGEWLQGIRSCSLAWGDYDNDGDLDLAYSGYLSGGIRSNSGGGFSGSVWLDDLEYCSLAWGDYDGDGDPDLALVGKRYQRAPEAHLYRTDPGGLVKTRPGLTPLYACSAAWADYDDDGDLDLAVAGREVEYLVCLTRICRNDLGAVANTPPAEITSGLSATVSGAGPIYDVTFLWDDAADAETPPEGLSYNLRVGTSSGGNEICSGMADASGRRLLPARGPIQPGSSGNSWTLRLPAGTYLWAVQAIDPCFAGGPWSAEGTVTAP